MERGLGGGCNDSLLDKRRRVGHKVLWVVGDLMDSWFDAEDGLN